MDTIDMNDASSHCAMIDTHCHLDDDAFASDLASVLEASREAGVCAWLLIGYARERWEAASLMARSTPGMVHSLGVHPSHAEDWSSRTAELLTQSLQATNAVAVGEFGLDFYRENPPFEVQRDAMIGQLRIAHELGLPAIFHMRDAETEMVQILTREERLPRMIFHSFDGSADLTDFILQHGAYVGVGGLATRQKSSGLREQLQRIPLDHMILETDAPYLVPARQKDRRNVPAHVRTIAFFLADLLGVPFDHVARQTTTNAEALFGSVIP